MPRNWYAIKAKADETAEISIYDEIGFYGVSAKEFIAELRAIQAPRIRLSINSPGGSVFDALAIYNALRQHPAQIEVRVMGVAASAASIVAMAGNRIVMPENTFMFIHNPLGAVFGNADDMREIAEALDKIAAGLISTYAARSGRSAEEVKALMDADTWLSAAEAVELGFADEMEPALKIAAHFDPARLPERVRASISPAPAQDDPPADPNDPAPAQQEPPQPPQDSLAAQINAAAVAAGLGEHVGVWLLDDRLTDIAAARAAIEESREIRDLCVFAKLPEMAPELIRARASLAEARSRLCAMRAAADEALHTDGHIPNPFSKPPSKPAPQAASPAAYWRIH